MGALRGLASAALVACAVLSLYGCGSNPPETAGSSPETTQTTTAPVQSNAGEWGSYPADTTLDERGAVEKYVEALDERNGSEFCGLVAPWISRRFDIGGTDPDAPRSHPVRCPEFVSGFIGYIEDCCPPEFRGATVESVGELDRRGDVVGVPITVTLHLERDGSPYDQPLEDLVWVTRDGGAWRIAKLSEVAAAASIGLQSEGDLRAPPNVAKERRAFADLVTTTRRQRRAREDAYRVVEHTATCAGATRYAIEEATWSTIDSRHRRPRHHSCPPPTFAPSRSPPAAVESASSSRWPVRSDREARSHSPWRVLGSIGRGPVFHNSSRSSFAPMVVRASRAVETFSSARSRFRQQSDCTRTGCRWCWMHTRSPPDDPLR